MIHDYIQDVLLILLFFLLFFGQRKINQKLSEEIINLQKQLKIACVLISEETKRKVAHTKAFENLVDPDKISEEMERGADILEARQADRLTAPRTDAGPPARVFRPKLTGKRASFWNPPRP